MDTTITSAVRHYLQHLLGTVDTVAPPKVVKSRVSAADLMQRLESLRAFVHTDSLAKIQLLKSLHELFGGGQDVKPVPDEPVPHPEASAPAVVREFGLVRDDRLRIFNSKFDDDVLGSLRAFNNRELSLGDRNGEFFSKLRTAYGRTYKGQSTIKEYWLAEVSPLMSLRIALKEIEEILNTHDAKGMKASLSALSRISKALDVADRKLVAVKSTSSQEDALDINTGFKTANPKIRVSAAKTKSLESFIKHELSKLTSLYVRTVLEVLAKPEVKAAYQERMVDSKIAMTEETICANLVAACRTIDELTMGND